MTALTITKDINDPNKVIEFEGPVIFDKSVKLVRAQAIRVVEGIITFNGTKASTKVDIDELTVDDPRDLKGVPTDAYHLGGIIGRIGLIKGTRLQRDLAKIGSGSNGLLIDHAIGVATAMELKDTFDPDHIPHQDGIQIMNGWNIVINQLDYVGGPDTQHAAFFCNPAGSVQDSGAGLIHDCMVLSGTIETKASGIVLGDCTRCGAKNMTITAKYPFRVNKGRTRQPIDENNKKIVVR